MKKWWKVFFKNDLFEYIDPEKRKENKTKLDKLVYRLVNEKVLIPIRSGVYIVPDKQDLKLNDVDLIEKYYFKLVKKYIIQNTAQDYYISWIKALEINMKNFEVPEKIFVINRKINKKISIWNKEIIFKTISTSSFWKKLNLFSKFSSYTHSIDIYWKSFKVSDLELSLLESALVSDNIEWLNLYLLNKAIKKYSKSFNKNKFKEIAKYKYIMSFNRLKEISKNIDNDLYKFFLDIIKSNGWLFIWEWLRGI